jgi:hypothetical protein
VSEGASLGRDAWRGGGALPWIESIPHCARQKALKDLFLPKPFHFFLIPFPLLTLLLIGSPLWVLEDSLFIFHEPTLSTAIPKFTTDHYTPLQARIPK